MDYYAKITDVHETISDNLYKSHMIIVNQDGYSQGAVSKYVNRKFSRRKTHMLKYALCV